METIQEIIQSGLGELGVPFDDGAVQALARYSKEVMLFNKVHNLVKVKDEAEFVKRHILDCASAIPAMFDYFASSSSFSKKSPTCAKDALSNIEICDVGSGAGLPGIVLAILLPLSNLTLIEKQSRRVNFLENAKAVLLLKNTTIVQEHFEKVAVEMAGQFDAVTFRAFTPLVPTTVATLLDLTKVGGALFSYKGRLSEIQKELAGCSTIFDKATPKVVELPPIKNGATSSPNERHLVVIPKK